MQGALEAMLAPNLWPTKWKLLEGSMQSNMTGLLCYQNLSEQRAENVPKEASREAGSPLQPHREEKTLTGSC